MTDTDSTVEQIEFKFSELSDKAKENARDDFKYRDGYPHDDWFNQVYEDANSIGEILGLNITNISFSGFSSQGDGACFKGLYEFNVDAIEQMKTHCNDNELIRIATQLTAMQIAQRLQGLAYFTARITQSGRYSHSNTMRVEIDFDDYATEDLQAFEDFEDDVAKLFRDFANWIYWALEAEHDYLCSDEVIDELLAEETFDEEGCAV